MKKVRLDQLVFDQGLSESRELAVLNWKKRSKCFRSIPPA